MNTIRPISITFVFGVACLSLLCCGRKATENVRAGDLSLRKNDRIACRQSYQYGSDYGDAGTIEAPYIEKCDLQDICPEVLCDVNSLSDRGRVDREALQCSLKNLGEGRSGRYRFHRRDEAGQTEERGTLSLLENGQAMAELFRDAEEGGRFSQRLGKIKESAYFEACLKRPGVIDRFECLENAVEVCTGKIQLECP